MPETRHEILKFPHLMTTNVNAENRYQNDLYYTKSDIVGLMCRLECTAFYEHLNSKQVAEFESVFKKFLKNEILNAKKFKT